MVTLGDRVQPDIYNRDLYRQGAGLLPVALRQIEGVPAPGNDSRKPLRQVSTSDEGISQPIHLASIVSDAPALELFRPEKGQDWSRARIRNYFMTAGPNSDDVRVSASYSNGAAALVYKKLGEGKVLLFTSAVDMDWSDLPVQPFYVPLMQNLVLDLASAVVPPRNLEVGQSLTHVASGDMARKVHQLYLPRLPNDDPSLASSTIAAADTKKPVTLTATHQGSLSVFSYEDTSIPGLYTAAPEGAASDRRVYYTVTADRDESDMTRLEDGDFQRLEKDIGAHYAPDWITLARFIGLDAGGYEITQYLIAAAIALCFVEIFLTRRWA